MASSASGGRPRVDYSLYLVTDSTPAILGDRDICGVVGRALRGGVTLVQYRDKSSDSGALITTAKRLHGITRAHAVPLLINDRVDVAMAVGCEGVHLGQDDMNIDDARRILGHDKIIGITANTVEEAVTACEHGADYLGVGTIFATQTKTNTKSVIGPEGLRHTLEVLGSKGHGAVPVVGIGGLNASNVFQVMFRGSTPGNPLSGVAVVSAVMAAEDPEAAARRLLELVERSGRLSRAPPAGGSRGSEPATADDLLRLVPQVLKAVHETRPLSHNMTNLVVQNFAANVALCVGASPIMANYGEEAGDLAKLGGALVINMGTVTPEGIENYKKALRAYNAAGRPVVFDPVGAGATAVRRAAVKEILAAGHVDVIKGNESEIRAVFGGGGGGDDAADAQRGVDSSSTLPAAARAALARALARRERCVVVLTGVADVVSDGGARALAVANGHALLGAVTGAGCTLGTAISAAVAVAPLPPPRHHWRVAAVVAGLLLFEIAAETAAAGAGAAGPGSFVPAFLDALYRLRMATAGGDVGWLAAAKVTVVE